MKYLMSSILGVSMLVVSIAGGSVRAEDTAPIRTGWAEVQFYSIDPEKGIDSYRRGSSGGAGLGGTFSATVDLNGSSLTIHVSARQRNGKFLADLETEKVVGDETSHPPELNREIDLTDLAPFSYELGRDADGFVQRMTIVPSLKTHPLPKQFRLSDLDLTDFNLSGLPVILNEQEFVGSAGVNGGEVISLGIAGLAEIEFSLIPFAGAAPGGQLSHGRLTIRHEKDELQINGVTSGKQEKILDGGPYQIFVRWEPPQTTLQQHIDSVKTQLDEFRLKASQGDLHAKLLLPKLETMTEIVAASIETKSRTAILYSSGARQLSAKERLSPPQ